MYTKCMFGKELKENILKKQDPAEIGRIAYSRYFEYVMEKDPAFRHILLALSAMEEGPEFAHSYEKLNEITDDLITGRDVDVSYECKYEDLIIKKSHHHLYVIHHLSTCSH